MKRRLILSVLGHVDHGKSSILDKIRNTAIVATEAGGITQAIGASIIPISTIRKICGKLLDQLNIKINIPGLLTIDTPGHAAFTNLRKRGGNLADIAILVIDINEGLKPQTIESLQILKEYKTPFVIAANKIDLIHGWQPQDSVLTKNITKQSLNTLAKFETKMYELVGQLQEHGFDAERFDRVEDYTKKLGIVPVSAKSGEGIPELLMIVTALAQKYLEKYLECDTESDGKGTILEVKEEKGLGTTLDVILYDGKLKVNDLIVIGSIDKPIVTKVRALLEPKPLSEMRDKKGKFKSMKIVTAATGVKISAPDIKNVIAGMPLRVANKENVNQISKEIQAEVKEVLVETDKKGIVIKADTLGSIEALTKLLREKDIKIRKASIGDINKKDLADAESNLEKDPLNAVILGFNIKSDVNTDNVKIITSPIIYKLIEDFEKWRDEQSKAKEAKVLGELTNPCKIKLMPGYVFRQSNPAVCGTEVLAGILKTGMTLMTNDGKEITKVKAIQEDKKNVSEAKENKQVAVSYEKVTIGRQVMEGDILYSAVTEQEFRKMKELKKYLSIKEIEVLKEIAKIKRGKNSLWGV